MTAVVYAWLTLGRREIPGWGEVIAGWTQLGTLALAVLLQIAVALIVAARIRRLGSLHALFATQVAGWISGVATIVVLAVFGLLWDDWLLTLLYISAFVLAGACAAGPLAVCTSALAARFRVPRQCTATFRFASRQRP